MFGWLAIHRKRPAKGPRACRRYPPDDHEADVSFAMPS
jgi:hypothetical protein